jgi:hypothetical protein
MLGVLNKSFCHFKKKMDLNLNFYVLTGGKKFSLGSVKDVKDFLRKAGVKVVSNVSKANAIIVPTGAKSKYNLPTYSWNDIIQKLKHPKPTKIKEPEKALQIVKTKTKTKTKTDPENEFDFDNLKVQLSNIPFMILNEKERKEIKEIKIPVHTISPDFGIQCMQQLTNPKIVEYLENKINPDFVLDLYPGIHLFYLQLEHLFKLIFQFWGDLRSNLNLFEPIPEVKVNPVCNDLKNWYDFQSVFNPFQVKEMCNLTNFPKPREVYNILNRLETDLIFMQFSIVCLHTILNDMFNTYTMKTRTTFRNCENLSAFDCSHACTFYNNKCQDKPFLIALDNIIKSFCESASDPDDITFLELNLEEIFINLYDIKPEEKETQCTKIIYMFEMIKKSLETMIGKSIQWSQVSDFLHISSQVWKDLWLGTLEEKKSSLFILSQLEEDPFFIQQTKQLIIALANVGI